LIKHARFYRLLWVTDKIASAREEGWLKLVRLTPRGQQFLAATTRQAIPR
jgi:hypothetical protein